jgi:hypothetical protein
MDSHLQLAHDLEKMSAVTGAEGVQMTQLSKRI